MCGHRRLRILTFVTCCGLILWSLGLANQQEKTPEKQTPQKNLVAEKLDYAQKVLAAVAQNDFSMVERHTEALIKNSKDLAWKTVRSERYEELGKEYRRELEGLAKAAKAKNNEAMALSYVKVSLACFSCHNHVREVRIAAP